MSQLLDDTITCSYPSVANPGTFNNCSYSESASWALTAGPSDICATELGLNSNVNLRMILTTLSSQAVPLHTVEDASEGCPIGTSTRSARGMGVGWHLYQCYTEIENACETVSKKTEQLAWVWVSLWK
ncbi:hypothetical protein BDR07DRAFT_1379552 [Suillus spraguei]|nr:hypothetical protein BDR07DRAFT_1379552 [Suillus spraguei]